MVEEIVRQRNRTTQAAAIKLHKKLEEVLRDKEGREIEDRVDDDFVQYIDGYNDAVVAQEMGAAESTVRRLRMEMFGNLESSFGHGRAGGRARIDALEERLRVVEEKLGIVREENGDG